MIDNTPPRRIYTLSPENLTEEQIAVIFARTSRSPESFDVISSQITQEYASDFNNRWVIGYGHASVAEHAVLHIAIENISRLAADKIESNRIASFTEKSSRYQIIDRNYFYTPHEILTEHNLYNEYIQSCSQIFDYYFQMIDLVINYLKKNTPQYNNESNESYMLRLRRLATDACRAVLPAAVLTNIGMTINARALAHMISKLRSSYTLEEQDIGCILRNKGDQITPTLLKYAEPNEYLENMYIRPNQNTKELLKHRSDNNSMAKLVNYDDEAMEKIIVALLCRKGYDYDTALRRYRVMTVGEQINCIDEICNKLSAHDAPPREFELVHYTFELKMDYGALREFRRHRMQTCLAGPLTIYHGVYVPKLIKESKMENLFFDSISIAENLYEKLLQYNSSIAEYAITHAHIQNILSCMNLRECYHIFKLRSSSLAHESIRIPIIEAMNLVIDIHPHLFKYLLLR